MGDGSLEHRTSNVARVVCAGDAVREAAALLAEALEPFERARLAIPGGSALAALGPTRKALGSSWSSIRLTWVDERCVAFEHPESNRGEAYRSGALSPEDPPACEVPLLLDGEAREEALERVRLHLQRDFEGALDVLLLGIGDDGHVASLFPGRAPPTDPLVAFVPDSPKPPAERLTLTPGMLQTASCAVVLATGEPKRDALRRLVSGDPTLPASALRRVVVVTDLDLGH
jgi:6-phosphogluconolactonase